jgi:hypothetical protein
MIWTWCCTWEDEVRQSWVWCQLGLHTETLSQTQPTNQPTDSKYLGIDVQERLEHATGVKAYSKK